VEGIGQHIAAEQADLHRVMLAALLTTSREDAAPSCRASVIAPTGFAEITPAIVFPRARHEPAACIEAIVN
jgi:hypothetical protein